MAAERLRPDRAFLVLLGFLTTLPVPSRLWPREPVPLADALPLAPLVGALLASLTGALYLLARPLVGGLPAAWLALALYVLCGWSLHLDGLSDLADGLGSHKEGEAMRAVMKDSRLGGFGALALVVTLGLWTSLVASLEGLQAFRSLLFAAVLGRFGLCLAAWRGSYPWESGLGRSIVLSFDDGRLLIALALTGLFLPLAPRAWAAATVAAVVTVLAVVALAEKRLGGTNGDVLGACQVLAETAALLAAAALA